ncbi:MAG: efflux RND transporter periplasmic adaptor subunit [Planctomycetes bacterium]|nr:efflux RND transporter periplasmic adaptor subunit [Planctomycetota bacterium]
MRRWIFRLVTLAILIGVAFLLRFTVWRDEPIPVRVVRVERGLVEATVVNSKAGTVRARCRAKISPGTSGIVVAVEARRGQHVGAGDPLLRIDDAIPLARWNVARAAVSVAEAQHMRSCLAAERARHELEHNRRLATSRVVSEDLLEELETRYDQAVAECTALQAEVEHQQANVALTLAELDKCTLRAPFEAIVAEDSVEVGEWATPSIELVQAPALFDLIDPTSLYVSAPMDEVDAAKIVLGQTVRVTIDAYPDRTFTGKVARIAPYVLDRELSNRTLEIEVVLDDQEFSKTLLPGTSADVEVLLTRREDVLRVPTFALLEGDRVLVVEGDHLVERTLKTGMRNWDFVEVLDGLREGDDVVLSLESKEVQAGAWVRVEGVDPQGMP